MYLKSKSMTEENKQSGVNSKKNYVEGIRGICCLWVPLFHFLLSFLPYGYIGWGSGVELEAQNARFFQHFASGAFLNSSFPLYLLISLIGFTIGMKYFETQDVSFLKKQAEKRYFRLMPAVFVTSLLAYAIFAFSLNYTVEAGDYVDGDWLVNSAYAQPVSLVGAIFSGLCRVFFMEDGDYCTVLWCYYIIFLGSFLVYGFLALLGTSKYRYGGYLFLTIALCYTGHSFFLCLVAGMIGADVAVHRDGFRKDSTCGGLGLVILGIFLGYFPSILLPQNVDAMLLPSLGIICTLLGVEKSRVLQKALSGKVVVALGKYGNSLVLVHMLVVVSITSLVYYEMVLAFENTGLSALVAFLVFAILTYLVCRLFYRFIEYPLLKLANKITEK